MLVTHLQPPLRKFTGTRGKNKTQESDRNSFAILARYRVRRPRASHLVAKDQLTLVRFVEHHTAAANSHADS